MVRLYSSGRGSRPIFLIGLFLSLSYVVTATQLDALTDQILTTSDDAVKRRLEAMDHELIEFRDHPQVRAIIRRYVEHYRDMSGKIIGRSTKYFPLFERHLREARLPEALKYLTITESALMVRAQSRVGALGLWQFMPGTAQEVGLRIDQMVDERLDPERATRAAMDYLSRLNEYFDDWALSMAAYNSGPGTVRRAIRRTGSRDYWRVRARLPRETRLYVPGFIAAAYLAEYYQAHDLSPELPPLDFQLTTSVLVEQPLSFKRISQITGLSLETLRSLNPAYKRALLPGYEGGHYLIIPRRVLPAITAYLDGIAGQEEHPPLRFFTVIDQTPHQTFEHSNYRQSSFRVEPGQTLTQIGRQLKVPTYLLAVWNSLGKGDTVRVGQRLRYYEIVDYVQLRRAESVSTTPTIASKKPERLTSAPQPLAFRGGVEVWVKLTRNTRLSDLQERYPQIDLETLRKLNQLEGDPNLSKGSSICLSRG